MLIHWFVVGCSRLCVIYLLIEILPHWRLHYDFLAGDDDDALLWRRQSLTRDREYYVGSDCLRANVADAYSLLCIINDVEVLPYFCILISLLTAFKHVESAILWESTVI